MKAFLIKKTSERRIPLQTGAYADTYVEFNLTDVEVNDLTDIEKAVKTDSGNLYVWNESPELKENGIVVLCDSKRDIRQKLPSVLMIGRSSGKIIDSLRGNILLIGYDSTALKMVSLTSEQKQVIGRVFKPGRYHKEYRYIDGYTIVIDEEDEKVDASRFRSDFKHIAEFYAARNTGLKYVPSDTNLAHPRELAEFFSVFQNDERFIDAYNKSIEEKEKFTMCDFVDKLEARGEARGEVIGKIKALAGLVKDGILTLSEAAKRAGMSV